MALDASVGGAASNSFVTQAEATAYFTDRLNAATLATWTAASTGDKDSYLIAATMRLEAETYDGSTVSTTQRLQWPRYSTYDRDGRVFASDAIPNIVQQATYELAFALVNEPTLLDSSGLEGFINVRVGSLDVTPRVGTPTMQLPALVKRLLAPVLKAGYGVHVVRA